MGQILQADKIGTMSQSAGIVTMAASSSVPSYLTIGGQQYQITASLTRTITSDVTLTLQNLYHVYAVVSAGVVVLRISTNLNSVGPAGFTSWKLVGAFYTDTAAAFNAFVSTKSITPSTTVTVTSTSPVTYVVPPKAALRVRMCGGGGGSVGSGTAGGSVSSGGGTTTFGSILTATGGTGGTFGSSGGAGGSWIIGAGAVGFGMEGTYGGGHSYTASAVGQTYFIGPSGGSCPLFGGGANGNGGVPFGLPVTGYGSGGAGGGGGGTPGFLTGAAGGGAGALDAIIANPASSYTVQCGGFGGGGGAGTSGSAGQQGIQGVIFIEEIKPNLLQLGDL
jgi:hypothetical protein